MDNELLETLVKSVHAEGKLVLDSAGHIICKNEYMCHLFLSFGVEVVMAAVTECLTTRYLKPDFSKKLQFRCIRVGNYSILSVRDMPSPVMETASPVISKEAGDDITPGRRCASAGIATGVDPEFNSTRSEASETKPETNEEHSNLESLRTVFEKVNYGFCIFRLDTISGSSTATFINSKYAELVGLPRDHIIKYGIPAVGNMCHPDDVPVSNVVCKDIVGRRSSGKWPFRCLINNEYKWRQYEIVVVGEPDNDQFVLMKAVLTDFTEEAAAMGLTGAPGIRVIQTADGGMSVVPIVHGEHQDEDGGSLLDEPVDMATVDVRSITTRGSVGPPVDLPVGSSIDISNVKCLKRYMSSRLIYSLSLSTASTEKGWLQIRYIPMDLHALKEEISLALNRDDLATFRRAINERDYILCSQSLARYMGVGVNWLVASGPTLPSVFAHISPEQSDRVALSFKLLLALLHELDDDSKALDLLRQLSKRILLLTQVGGSSVSQLVNVELTLSLLTVAIRTGLSEFKIRDNYAWLGNVVGSVIDSVDSQDGLVLQGMYWISVQWAYLHMILGQDGIGVEILRSTLEDIQEYLEQFPGSCTAVKLQKIIAYNLTVAGSAAGDEDSVKHYRQLLASLGAPLPQASQNIFE